MHHPLVVAAAVVAAGSLAACASSPGSAGSRISPEACAAQPIDSLFLRGGTVYRACEVDQQVRRSTATRRVIPTANATSTSASCLVAEFELVIDTTGVPEVGTAKLVRWSDPQFARDVLATMPAWRYSAARKGGSAVRQVVRDTTIRATDLRPVVAGSAGGATPPSGGMGERPPICQ